MPEWPWIPEIWLVRECPEGLVCITLTDHLVLVHYQMDIDRELEYLNACPQVEFVPLEKLTPPTETPGQTH